MTRDAPDPDAGVIPDSDAQRRAFESVRAEVSRQPQRATVIADASGHWFHYFCPVCGKRGQAAKDKKLIAMRAKEHDGTHA